MRALATVALLAVALLAGCSSSPDKAKSDSGPSFDDLGLEATSSTGVIRGVVVDDAVRPLAGAKVSLLGDAPKETVSTAMGTFGFDSLLPGTYFLKVHKAGFADAQQSADVVAGVSDPGVVKVQLLPDASTMPYYENYVFDGFIECSGTFVVVGAALCSIPNGLTDQTGNVTQDNFGVRYQLSKTPTWIQSEMVWDSTQAFGGEMTLDYSWECDTNDGFLCDHGASGKSPVLVTADAAAIAEINGGDYTQPLFVRAFNQGVTETDGLVGATIEQKFTVYTHVFYGYQPPEGWRFSDGGEVPQPSI